MTSRLAKLIGLLAMSIVLFVSVNVGAADIELTNDTLVSEQPCYNKATTVVLDFRGVTTWCDVRLGTQEAPGSVYCTSTAEPKWCESGDAK